MTFYDAFHGIGGFRYGLEQAGWECVGGCEIDKFACQAYGVIFNERCEPTDITTVDPVRLPDFDVFVGGFPCQDLSIAGHRKGFDGERSVLFFEILRICEVKRPNYILLENVTGLLSHNGGETFEIVLQSLDELGYDAEWQVLNSAAYVPQNRERVFIIGHLRGASTRAVFPFGAENSDPIEVIGRLDDDTGQTGLIYSIDGIAPTQLRQHGNAVTKVAVVGNTNPSGNGMNGQVYDSAGLAPTLTTNKGEGNRILLHPEPRAVISPEYATKTMNGRRIKDPGEAMFALTVQDRHGITDGYRIRKLTPLECFRLQSFPDEWYYKLKEHRISDSQLYKMAGNAVTSRVAYEIGKRLCTDPTE